MVIPMLHDIASGRYSSMCHWIQKQRLPILRNKLLVIYLNLIKDSREIQIILVGSAWRGGKVAWRGQSASRRTGSKRGNRSKRRKRSKRGKKRGAALRETASKRRARSKRRTELKRRTKWSIKSPSRIKKSTWRATRRDERIRN